MTPGALRTLLAVIGGLAGIAYWMILDEEVLRALPFALQLFVSYFLIAVFPAFGLIAGPIAPPRAAGLAIGIALLGAALVTWAGFRFAPDTATLEPTNEGLFIGPFLALTSLIVPFAIAYATDKERWNDYTILFDTAWSAVVKSAITLLFVLLFWAIYFLCNALLELVGIDILEEIAGEDWAWPMITGIVTGLSLAVSCELDAVILTLRGLILRLLRLLLIPVTLVVGIFLIAVLVTGVDEVFRGWSAAATMMSISAGAVTLIAATLGHDDEDASQNAILIGAARALALMLPVVAAIAVYAVWLRVEQYGWTPARLAALLIALIVVAYALPPALFVARAREGWMDRIRTGFVAVVIGIIAVSALWFTPALNAQRIAANDQYQRFLDGRIEVENFEFWPMAFYWGQAGRERLEALKDPANFAQAAEITARIDSALNAEDRWQAHQLSDQELARQAWDELRPRIPTIPEGRVLPASADLPEVEPRQGEAAASLAPQVFWSGDLYTIRNIATGCDQTHDDGFPLCIAVFADFFTDKPGEEIMLISQRRQNASPDVYMLQPGSELNTSLVYVGWAGWDRSMDLFTVLRSGDFTIGPPPVQGIRAGTTGLYPNYR